jgi:hypothetical protein
METEAEHCKKCGSVVYAFSKDVAVSDGSVYCIRCAEEIDRYYLARNVCSVCTRLLDKNEVKFVMPSRLYSSYFFDKLPIEHRLMCAHCYRKVSKLNIIREPLIKIYHIRLRLRRALAKRAVIKSRNS